MQGGRRAFGATCSLPPTQRLLLQVDREGGRAEEEVAGLATVLRDGLFGMVVSLSWGGRGELFNGLDAGDPGDAASTYSCDVT